MHSQITSNILMIRPVAFAYNEQTAESNEFMNEPDSSNEAIQKKARQEFDHFVRILQLNNVNVVLVEDTNTPHKPDSIFPNNWVSFHHSGKVVLYPMEAPNRRVERRMDIIDAIRKNFEVNAIIDLSPLEAKETFLEGTGSLVLDRENKKAYASISSRTSKEALGKWSESMPNYEIITFTSLDKNGTGIYHTNVMMCVGDTFAVVCLESIADVNERLRVKNTLEQTKKIIVEITLEQVYSFAGNMLLIANKIGQKLLCMSSRAFNSLTEHQKNVLSENANILQCDISTIEKVAGGSIRCMMAEIHLMPLP